MNWHRILCLEGSGLLIKWNVYLMAKLEKDLDFLFKDRFNTFVTTSTASLIVGGFIANKTLFDIYKDILSIQNNVFSKSLSLKKKKVYLLKNKFFYNYQIYKDEIYKILDPNLTFGQIKDQNGYFIFAVDVNKNKIKVFGKGICDRFNTLNNSISEAILAASSLPLYFGPIENKDYELLIDGSVVLPNPVLQSLIALMSNRIEDKQKYTILSLSTPTFIYPEFQRIRANKKHEYMFSIQKKLLVNNIAKVFIEDLVGKQNALFINPLFTQAIELDCIDPNKFEKHFKHHYFLNRKKIKQFLENSDIIQKGKSFQLKEGQNTEIDVLINSNIAKWNKKPLKQNYSDYFENIF